MSQIDPHRPRYHFLPPANWMNDPNGLIHWQGQYHLFYQYNPDGAYHGRVHWGHAVSQDLVYWQDLPIALTPTEGEHDAQGCWSGCAVNYDGVPTLIYTGVYPQVVCAATSSDGLKTWQKSGGNPLIAQSPPDIKNEGHFRDPFVWRENERWYMIIGSKIENVGGIILLYQSNDLLGWEYLGPLMVGNGRTTEPLWTGTMWKCPNLLDFGEKRVLFFSVQATPVDLLHPVFFTGRYQDHQFTPEVQGIMVHGDYFYAPLAMRDENGRTLIWGWLREGRGRRACEKAGWAGVMSLPLVASLQPDGWLALEPTAELQTLRREHWHAQAITLEPDSFQLLDAVQGDSLEISVEFEFTEDAELGLVLRRSPDGQEQTHILFQAGKRQLTIDREQASASLETDRDSHTAPINLAAGQSLTLHIFLDRSVIEIFTDNGRTTLVSRIYPLRPDSLGIGLFSRQGRVNVKSINVWQMDSIWP